MFVTILINAAIKVVCVMSLGCPTPFKKVKLIVAKLLNIMPTAKIFKGTLPKMYTGPNNRDNICSEYMNSIMHKGSVNIKE